MLLIDARTGLEHLTRDECLALLAGDEVGRLAVVDGGTPHVFPVNYVLDGDGVVFRTDPGLKLRMAGGRASFEIDDIDRRARSGWSVVVTGRLEEVTRFDARTYERVRALGVDPWAGDKQHWMRLAAEHVTGRRIRPSDPSAGH